MGFKPNFPTSTTTERWGLGLLFLFFPEHEDNKKKKLSSSSSFNTSCSTTNNVLLFTKKAQSTISIFVLMLFFTLLVFTISTFEPPALPTHSPSLTFPRKLNHVNSYNYKAEKTKSSASSALQGMGVVFSKGTKSMSDLIVAHLDEDTRIEDLRLFLRTLHRSTILTTSDVVFIFPHHSHSSTFSTTIHQENQSFLKFISSNSKSSNSGVSKKKPSGNGEPLWGPRTHGNNTSTSNNSSTSWGSVVGFVADELNPENSLSGFLDHVPIQLRRWACYPMLLGRVRRNFKHVMLVDVKDVVILGDALTRVRGRSAESVYFYTIDNTSPPRKHGRKNSEKTLSKLVVTSDVITGGIRGIRRLSEAMLNQIVRVAMQHKNKNKNPVSDSSVLSQLVQNEFLLKTMNIDLSISESALVTNLSASLLSLSSNTIVYRGNRNIDLNYILGREICSSTLNSSSVYIDC